MTMYLDSRSDLRLSRFRIDWNFFNSPRAFTVLVMFSNDELMNTCRQQGVPRRTN